MWYSKQDAKKYKKNFKIYKIPHLPSGATEKRFAKIKLGNFLGMLRYFDSMPRYGKLKVYIGMYSDERTPRVPANCGKQLMVIFSPADDDGKDLDPSIYYFIPPNMKFDAKNSEFQIDKQTKETWTKNYYLNMPNNTIDTNNRINVCDTCHDSKPTDTKMVVYSKSGLSELTKEQEYCHKNRLNIWKIGMSRDMLLFFTAQDTIPIGRPNYRITLDLGFTKSSGKPFYLQHTHGFRHRKSSKLNDLDKGQLCPTYCP
jgi:hypothetical protein